MKILLIEDTVELGEILIDILNMEGYDTIWTTNPVKGLRAFYDKRPDLVITDLVMPEMDGLEVVKEIRKSTSGTNVPIIVLSAKASPEDEKLSYTTGANLHLQKPCESNDLIDEIKLLLKCKK